MTPEPANWDLSQIAAVDPARAAKLGASRKPVFAEAITAALTHGSAQMRLGWEFGDREPTHPRAVVQFPVPPDLFDRVMNGIDGYRARYSVSPENGHAYNAEVILQVVGALAGLIPDTVQMPTIGPSFLVTGSAAVNRVDFLRSLEPDLSKLWMATVLIGEPSGLPIAVEPVKIHVPDRPPWASLMQDAASSWLDIKGAFLGPDGLYQVKPVSQRNERLWRAGEA
jgi:hypothetical protein